jgi:hypothetical protein
LLQCRLGPPSSHDDGETGNLPQRHLLGPIGIQSMNHLPLEYRLVLVSLWPPQKFFMREKPIRPAIASLPALIGRLPQ